MQRSPPSVPVGASHHSLMSLASDSSSISEADVCEDSIISRYQMASESLIPYSSMFGK